MLTVIAGRFKNSVYIEVFFCCLGFMVFSFFIRYSFPFILMALAGLALSAYIISRQIHSLKDVPGVFGLLFPRKIILYLIVGLQLGLLYALVYRKTQNQSLFPEALTWFAFPAAAIGAAEELVFRGFIQGYSKQASVVFAVLFATFAHTAYKCCLFLAPVNTYKIDISFLVIWTFIGGLLFGILKETSKSVLPAVLAHLSFDVLVYGEFMQSPWWVW